MLVNRIEFEATFSGNEEIISKIKIRQDISKTRLPGFLSNRIAEKKIAFIVRPPSALFWCS